MVPDWGGNTLSCVDFIAKFPEMIGSIVIELMIGWDLCIGSAACGIYCVLPFLNLE